MAAIRLLLLLGIACVAVIDAGLDTDKALKGFERTKNFIDTINEKGFTEVLKEFTATIKPWTETQHIMANFFRIFKPEEDAMMAAMNKGFAEVNSRLDDIKGLLEDVIEAIDWTVMKIQFSALEQKIISLTTALRDAYQAPDSEAGRKKFLVQYHLTYENSGSLLYTSIIHDDWVFQKNILKAGMIYTKHTRASVQNLMKGLISLLMKAAALEIASDSFMGWETGIEVIWEDKLKECKEAMARTDEYLEDKWMELMAQEMDDLAKDNQGRSHSEFADVAYKFFSTKYYWQNWFVLSYDQLSTYKEHATRTTMTYSHLRFRWFGRNYLVATRRKDFDWDRSIAWKWLKDTECYRPKEFCVREPAKVLNENLPSAYSIARAILKEHSSWAWRAPDGHTVHDTIDLWGYGKRWPFFVIYFG